MGIPKVCADFNNADEDGRLRLNCQGTTEDRARQGIILRQGLHVLLYQQDKQADGTADDLGVEPDPETGLWVARIDWQAIRHRSE